MEGVTVRHIDYGIPFIVSDTIYDTPIGTITDTRYR